MEGFSLWLGLFEAFASIPFIYADGWNPLSESNSCSVCLNQSSFEPFQFSLERPSCFRLLVFQLMWRRRFKRGVKCDWCRWFSARQHLPAKLVSIPCERWTSLRCDGEGVEGGESWSLTNLASFPGGSWAEMKRSALSVSICVFLSLCLRPSLCCCSFLYVSLSVFVFWSPSVEVYWTAQLMHGFVRAGLDRWGRITDDLCMHELQIIPRTWCPIIISLRQTWCG